MAVQGAEIQEIPEMEILSDSDTKRSFFIPDEPSPRGVLEIPILGSDSDNSGNIPTCSPIERTVPSTLQWKQMIDIFKKKSVRRFSVVPLLATYDIIAKKNMKKKMDRLLDSVDVVINLEGMPVAKPSWRNFDYSELQTATSNFSSKNLIGEGGHAKVYRGYLPDGQVVAIKKIIKAVKEEEDRIGDFLSELGIIAHVNHPNTARLLGFSIDNGLHLVLEFLPNGSLATVLHGGEEFLDWKKRFKVALGIAEGLQYLHHDCPRRIIHRDIKASNILLTVDYEAQISDFGLAKWLPENWVHHIVFPIEGTFGYLAPEYFIHGVVDEKTDVFAYGVLLLEIITGRHAVDSSRQSLAMWAKPLLEENKPTELVDPRLGNDYDPVEMKRAMLTALLCIQHVPGMRPHMNTVVQLLKGEESGQAAIEMTQKVNSTRVVILDCSDSKDYDCDSYIDDLHRHKQLVMG